MHITIKDNNWDKKVEDFLREAHFSGERIVLQGKDGVQAALVPMEDLEILEEIDP